MSVPFGAPYSDFGIYDTGCCAVCDLTNRCYFLLRAHDGPDVIWAESDKLDFAPGAPVVALDPGDIGPGR